MSYDNYVSCAACYKGFGYNVQNTENLDIDEPSEEQTKCPHCGASLNITIQLMIHYDMCSEIKEEE